MRILAIDLSTSTGWSFYNEGKYIESGLLPKVYVEDFNVNDHPNHSPLYPYNIIRAAKTVGHQVAELLAKFHPERVVIENVVHGRNRHTNRVLDWCHYVFIEEVKGDIPMTYMDPSHWRSVLELRLNKDQKKNNRDVSAGKKRGRINRKHLAINYVNERFGLKLKMKENDVADAIGLGAAYVKMIGSAA